MPIPTPQVAPYDSWQTILNATKLRLRHRMPSLVAYSGNVLDATQADTLQAANNALRRLQDGMCDAGATRFQDDIVIQGIPVAASQDPATVCSISWTGCYDGVNSFATPALPGNMIRPLWLSERATGQNANFPPPSAPNMLICNDGVPKRTKAAFNFSWQWRNDTLYYPGATQAVDFWIYFQSYLADAADVGNQRWFNTQVPIMRCQDPLCWWLCREFASAMTSEATQKGDAMIAQQAASFAGLCEAQAEAATKKLVNRDIGPRERGDTRRRPYGNGGGSGGNRGW